MSNQWKQSYNNIMEKTNYLDSSQFTMDKNHFSMDKNHSYMEKQQYSVDKNHSSTQFSMDKSPSNTQYNMEKGQFYRDKYTEKSQFNMNKHQFNMDKNQFSLDKHQFSSDKNQFSMDKNQFSMDSSQFSMDKNQFSLDKNQFSMDKNQFSLDKNQYRSSTSRYNYENYNDYSNDIQGASSSSNIIGSMGTNSNASGGGGGRETGIIEKLLHSYGFIQCCERQARLFFHFSQFSGNIEHLKIGDPVEFEMTYDRRTGKPIASTVTKIAPEVVLSEERVTGNVTTELRSEDPRSPNSGTSDTTQGRISYENRGECFFLPYTKDDVEGNVTLRAGDTVSFQIATNQRGNLGACHIRLENPAHPVHYRGVVCSMKESFGFIERADVVKEIFFHFSEAKGIKDELRLGDDVEFTIHTRNGKEVACNISRLPPGTVIFEDISPDIMRGQVLKPVDRASPLGLSNTGSGANTRHAPDPLPGRIRYRAPDHSEVEIPFGERDQCGDFTLRHGDWVEFQVATDRRDQLHRATNISLLDESFVVSGERREQGVVCTVKDGFGFLKCVDRDTRLFFHYSEVLTKPTSQCNSPNTDSPKRNVNNQDSKNSQNSNQNSTNNRSSSIRHISVGEEFEFTVVQDQNHGAHQYQRLSAIRMKRLPPGTVKFETVQETNISGTVTKTPEHSGESGNISYQKSGEGKKSIPYYSKDVKNNISLRVGDQVLFNVCQIKRTKEQVAMDIELVNNTNSNSNGGVQYGYIAALKDGFGFIETSDHENEVFFHFSNYEGDPSTLDLGHGVNYTLSSRPAPAHGGCTSAELVRSASNLPTPHPLPSTETVPVYSGTIIRPLRSVQPEQKEYTGLIKKNPPGTNNSTSNTGTITDSTTNNTGNTNSNAEENITNGSDMNNSTINGNGENASNGNEPTTPTDEDEKLIPFGIMSLVNKRELLQIKDNVQFQIDTNGYACNITAIRKRCRARVDTCKGPFGFLLYEPIPATTASSPNNNNNSTTTQAGSPSTRKLFFHMSEVRGGGSLHGGDTVEFELVTNQRTGKCAACNVTKINDTPSRPERLINRVRGNSQTGSNGTNGSGDGSNGNGGNGGPRLTVLRQPRGPDGSKGFNLPRNNQK